MCRLCCADSVCICIMCAMHLLLCYDLTGVRITKLSPFWQEWYEIGKILRHGDRSSMLFQRYHDSCHHYEKCCVYLFICKKSLVVLSHTERGVTFMLCPEDVSGLDCVCLLAPCFITSACRVRRGRGLPALAQLRAGPGCAAPCPSVCGVLSHSTVSASEKLNTCLISHWNHLQAVLLWVKLRAQLTISLDCSKWDVIWCYLHMLNCRCRYIYRYRL